jgi:riboflavin synthase
MFSGIIKEIGTVTHTIREGTTLRLRILSPISGDFKIDQSVSHNGVCLTIIHSAPDSHEVQVVAETLSKTNLGHLQIGDQVNLEKSITLSTLLDGHLVQGHIDTVLRCMDRKDLAGSWKYSFELPEKYKGLIIPHGSICLNGVSLTVANIYDHHFDVAIIPYTFEHTNFKHIHMDDLVNVEFDLIGKYIERQAGWNNRK